MKAKIAKFSIVLIPMMISASLISYAVRHASTGISPGRIVATNETTVPRFDHTATLLPNGKVLIAGGMERNGLIEPTAELYDPATRAFTFLGRMKSPHGWGSSAVLLKNGKVLIVGGSSGFC